MFKAISNYKEKRRKAKEEARKFDEEMRKREKIIKVFTYIALTMAIIGIIHLLDGIYTFEKTTEILPQILCILGGWFILSAWVGLTVIFSTQTLKGIMLNLLLSFLLGIIIVFAFLFGYADAMKDAKVVYY